MLAPAATDVLAVPPACDDVGEVAALLRQCHTNPCIYLFLMSMPWFSYGRVMCDLMGAYTNMIAMSMYVDLQLALLWDLWAGCAVA